MTYFQWLASGPDLEPSKQQMNVDPIFIIPQFLNRGVCDSGLSGDSHHFWRGGDPSSNKLGWKIGSTLVSPSQARVRVSYADLGTIF